MERYDLLIDNVNVRHYYDSNGDRVIKLENLLPKNKNKNIIIDCYYPSIPNPYYRYTTNISPHTWNVPDKEMLKDCSYITLKVDDYVKKVITLLPNKNLRPINEKVFCVGLNKTGTSSLAYDLGNLGYKVWGNEENLLHSQHKFSNNSIGTYIDLIEKTEYNFFNDIPLSCPGISERIVELYPSSKFILTVRKNEDKWVNSVKKFWDFHISDEGIKSPPNPYYMDIYVNGNKDILGNSLLNMFTTWNLDKYQGSIDDKLRQVYNYHNESVINKLEEYGCDWIEVDVSEKNELKRVTDWLGIDNTKFDFSWINKTKK